mgnify:CR=1 FL=1
MKKILIKTGEKRLTEKMSPIYMESLFVQRYVSATDVIFKIHSPCAMHLLEWILNEMNEWNLFTMTRADKKRFAVECAIKGGKDYSVSSVDKGLKALKDAEIIISTNEHINSVKTRTSTYYVNPHYYWKSSSKVKREELVRAMESERYES